MYVQDSKGLVKFLICQRRKKLTPLPTTCKWYAKCAIVYSLVDVLKRETNKPSEAVNCYFINK